MKFRTEIEKQSFSWEIRHQDRLLSLGSCFAERIGGKLVEAKFENEVNPGGIAYHPLAIARQVELALAEEAPEARELNGLWHAFEMHSRFNDPEKGIFEQKVNGGLSILKKGWEQADTILLTWGTAWVYRRNDNKELVSNCHKYPAAFFTKELLTVERIVEAWQRLMKAFPQKQFLLTVSPVRHTKDSIPLNSLSKSILRVASQQLVDMLPNVSYFPSFEIMMDDLRDYRFYESDLIHPNEMATQYIWEKFSESFFSTSTQQLIHKWGKLQSSLQHRPFQTDTVAYQAFLTKLEQQLLDLSTQLDLKEELEKVRLRQKK